MQRLRGQLVAEPWILRVVFLVFCMLWLRQSLHEVLLFEGVGGGFFCFFLFFLWEGLMGCWGEGYRGSAVAISLVLCIIVGVIRLNLKGKYNVRS